LDTFIREHTKENDFQWTVLQEMCYQLVDSVAWLHQGNIYYDGRLHPRNIFVKRSEGDKWKVQLKIPEKLNPFNNLDELYTQLWSSIKKPNSGKTTEEKCEKIKRDLISVIILLYFIQSTGNHPFQRGAERDNYQAINNQIQEEIFQVEALNKTCFCTVETGCEEKMACKYRSWINSLAQKHTKTMLTELFQENKQYTNQSVEKLKDHPFFWKTVDVLTFIERSSSYLHEGGNGAIERNFGVFNNSIGRLQFTHLPCQMYPKIFLELQGNGGEGNDYKCIFEYLHETKNFQTGEFNSMKNISSFGVLIKQIRNKV
jgi:hypothetical protein